MTVSPVPPGHPARPNGPPGTAPDPPFRPPSLRAALGFLLAVLLLGSVAYTGAVGGFADLVGPRAPPGTPVGGGNASQIASELLGQNISNPALFWLRPSLSDWSTLAGPTSPYGPTDPALLNSTRAYLAEYGVTNATVPIDLVSPSASGLDPDLTPGAVLVQVPRVANASGLSEAFLLAFVEAHVQEPLLGFVGPAYVNVITLDLALLPLLGG